MKNYDQAIRDTGIRMQHESIEAKDRQSLSDSFALAKEALEKARDMERYHEASKALKEKYAQAIKANPDYGKDKPLTRLAIIHIRLRELLGDLCDVQIDMDSAIGDDEGILELFKQLRKGHFDG